MPADLEQLAYESALRALDKQERLVEELRARTGIVLAASSVVASFLGRQSLGGVASQIIVAFAIVCFAATVAAGVFVLLPKRGLVFSVRGISVSDDPSGIGEVLQNVTDALDGFWIANDELIGELPPCSRMRLLRWAWRSWRRWPS